jgi:hypothetical protein
VRRANQAGSVKPTEHQNLLTLRPKRNLEWESGDGNLVVLVVPKFRSKLLTRWFVPMLAKPNIRVKLDERGSFVWQRCDGDTTVESIGEQMSRAFNEPVESSYDRIGKFIQQLSRNKFLCLPVVG